MSRARFDGSYGANPAESYERFFVPSIGEPLARNLVDRVGIGPTDRVLDVACGTGVVARLVAQRLDGQGAVAGLDPNPAMLAVARAAAPAAATVTWHEAPAEHMPLPDASFDTVVCQMGLQFMTDRVAAAREMRRVLAPGGRIWLSVPGPIAGIFAELAAAMERHVGLEAARFVGQVFSLHDVDEIEQLLRDAGFHDVVVEATHHELELPLPQDFLWQYVHSTPLIGVVSQASAESRSAMEREVLAAWKRSVRGDALQHPLRLVVATGRSGAAA